MKGKVSKFFGALSGFACLILSSCIEEIPLQPDENAQLIPSEFLVVDARISNAPVPQTVYLTEAYALGAEGPGRVRGAQVYLEDDLGMQQEFFEVQGGTYTSLGPLDLQSSRRYSLVVRTADGSEIQSAAESLPGAIEINEVRVAAGISDLGVEGVRFFLDNDNPEASDNFFRFEYEETYRIVSPDYNPFVWDEVDYDYFQNDDDGWEATIKPREENVRVCYASDYSTDIILGNTAELVAEGLENFEVLFLNRENPKIGHRYSILIKQYHQNPEAHSYFQTLLDFSEDGFTFNNVQPGSIATNLTVAANNNLQALGYFELASYSESRLFFNYADLYPGAALPPFFVNCDPVGKPPLYPEGFHTTVIDGQIVLDGTSNSPLLDQILGGLIHYIGDNPTYFTILEDGTLDLAPYLVKAAACVDCTVLGSTAVPDFWEE